MPEQVLSLQNQPAEKPFPWRCPKCRQPTVTRVTMPYRCQRTLGSRVVTVEVPNLTVPRCSNCGETVFDYAADEQIRVAFWSQFGPAETGTEGTSMNNHSREEKTAMPTRKETCRSKLIETAAARSLITFGELANHLGMNPRGPWNNMLDEIYEDETAAGRPDLTLLVIYAKPKEYPPYLSRGGPTRSVEFDPNNLDHHKAWNAELTRIYQTWAPPPKA